MVMFNEQYYQRVISEYGYDPLDFKPIDFTLPGLEKEVLRKKWLCHHKGDVFAEGVSSGHSGIVTTGFGLSGVPHVGTISQMLGAIMLQCAGLKVQIVLGDLDAYNARNQPIEVVEQRASAFAEFIIALGFDEKRGILRRQIDHSEILLTTYLIANSLRDIDFARSEEDISELYKSKGVYPGIEFPVKQAILLMTADFIHLGKEYEHVLVMLGLDEHRYIRLARDVVSRMKLSMTLGGVYSRMNRGLRGYPKMSKSIPGSAITADMKPEAIRDLVVNENASYDSPWDSPVYQMMCSASFYNPEDLDLRYRSCQAGDSDWHRFKCEYAEVLIDICRMWPHDKDIKEYS